MSEMPNAESTGEGSPIAERELVITRLIDAPRAALYRCWTEPELLVKWFAPKPWSTPTAELDVRPGGICRIVMRSPEGQDFPNPGVYLDVVPNEKLVFTDAFVTAWEPSTKAFMVGTVTFADEGGKTRYTARVQHWSKEDREAHESMGFHEGWGLGPLRRPARRIGRHALTSVSRKKAPSVDDASLASRAPPSGADVPEAARLGRGRIIPAIAGLGRLAGDRDRRCAGDEAERRAGSHRAAGGPVIAARIDDHDAGRPIDRMAIDRRRAIDGSRRAIGRPRRRARRASARSTAGSGAAPRTAGPGSAPCLGRRHLREWGDHSRGRAGDENQCLQEMSHSTASPVGESELITTALPAAASPFRASRNNVIK